ncbi:hypothetical protein [Streptomyces sp. NPDC059949]|uniref:hypothetical protein n=1 Tax=Streptomyces sp. NPDC059949 TaxID=3347013 RepID=UPI003649A6A9
MTALPPFSGDEPTCAKCGYAGARTEYLPFGDCAHEPGARVTIGWTANERLHRECQRCGHQWDEAVVSAAKPSSPAGPPPIRGCTSTTLDFQDRARHCHLPARHASPHSDGSDFHWDNHAEETS